MCVQNSFVFPVFWGDFCEDLEKVIFVSYLRYFVWVGVFFPPVWGFFLCLFLSRKGSDSFSSRKCSGKLDKLDCISCSL